MKLEKNHQIQKIKNVQSTGFHCGNNNSIKYCFIYLFRFANIFGHIFLMRYLFSTFQHGLTVNEVNHTCNQFNVAVKEHDIKISTSHKMIECLTCNSPCILFYGGLIWKNTTKCQYPFGRNSFHFFKYFYLFKLKMEQKRMHHFVSKFYLFIICFCCCRQFFSNFKRNKNDLMFLSLYLCTLLRKSSFTFETFNIMHRQHKFKTVTGAPLEKKQQQ